MKNKDLDSLKQKKISHRVMAILCMAIFMSIQAPGAFALDASYYSYASLKSEGTWKHGERRMANGERFNEEALTCATRLYPLGTYLRVRNNENGKSVVVKVTDRIGKRFAQTRIDLSKKAFEVISGKQGLKKGLLRISVEVVR